MPKKKTNDEFVAELKNKNPSINPLEPYVNSTTKILCKCVVCGHIWEVAPAHLLHGSGCPVCARKRAAQKRAYTSQVFSSKLAKVNPNIEVVGEYVNSQTKITVHCKICNNTWSVVPSSLLQGTGCPKCNKRYRKKTGEFIEELKSVNPHIVVLGNYKNAHEKITVQCDRCGTVWDAEPNALLKGNDCPVCTHSQTSIVEQLLYNSFVLLVGADNVSNRNKKVIGQELDIYIQNLRLAIEYGAWFWHSKRIKRDVEKERLCEQSGIHLITIYEGCPKDAVIVGLNNLIRYEKAISSEKDYLTIQGLLFNLCEKYNLDYSIIRDQWNLIVKHAKEDSRKKDAVTFVKELALKNPDIKYISDYTGSKDPVYVSCKRCGTKWYASSAYDLLHGHGCPNCAKKQRGLSQRMDHESFKKLVASVNPQIELLEEYRGSNRPIRCRCKKCGTEWITKPERIRYKKTNCPNCSPVTKKTNDVFLEELSAISDTIVPLEKYINGRTGIRFKCKECGYEWVTSPRKVLKGTGCPKCAHHITLTHDEFVKRMKDINSQIEIIGQYVDTKTKIKCRCLVCNYEWLAIPSNMLRGAGCPKCAGTLKLTNKDFVKRLASCNPTVRPLEQYVNNKTKINCQCKVCGHEWRTTPNNLLNGHGCPRCKAKKASKDKSKKIRCIETNQVYNSIQEAKKATGITTISDCLHNRTKTAGGYHWEYVNNTAKTSINKIPEKK